MAGGNQGKPGVPQAPAAEKRQEQQETPRPRPTLTPVPAPAEPKGDAPSLGRIVRYNPVNPEVPQRAALISGLHEDSFDISLHVFNPRGVHPVERVPYAEDNSPGTWSWPPRA